MQWRYSAGSAGHVVNNKRSIDVWLWDLGKLVKYDGIRIVLLKEKVKVKCEKVRKARQVHTGIIFFLIHFCVKSKLKD